MPTDQPKTDISAADPDHPFAAPEDDVLALERFLPYRLSVLANTVSRALARQYQERFGLNIPQWRVMAVLGRFPDLSANEVAEKTAMDKVMVSRAVAGLLQDGRLERRLSPTDRRRSSLRLSRDGHRVYAQIVPLAQAYERALVEALGPEDMSAMDRAIDRLLSAGQSIDIGKRSPSASR